MINSIKEMMIIWFIVKIIIVMINMTMTIITIMVIIRFTIIAMISTTITIINSTVITLIFRQQLSILLEIFYNLLELLLHPSLLLWDQISKLLILYVPIYFQFLFYSQLFLYLKNAFLFSWKAPQKVLELTK